MADILSLMEPPEQTRAPEILFPSREAFCDWIDRKALSAVWYAAEEAERRLDEKYRPGAMRLEEDQGAAEGLSGCPIKPDRPADWERWHDGLGSAVSGDSN